MFLPTGGGAVLPALCFIESRSFLFRDSSRPFPLPILPTAKSPKWNLTWSTPMSEFFRRIFLPCMESPIGLWVTEIRKKQMSLFDRVTARVEKSLVENPRCQRFFAVSHLAREVFLREYPRIEASRVQIVHPGVDIRRFANRDRDQCRQEVRREFGLDPKEFLILFVSMNFEIKGLAELMAGVAKLKSKHRVPPFKLLVMERGMKKSSGDSPGSCRSRTRSFFWPLSRRKC